MLVEDAINRTPRPGGVGLLLSLLSDRHLVAFLRAAEEGPAKDTVVEPDRGLWLAVGGVQTIEEAALVDDGSEDALGRGGLKGLVHWRARAEEAHNSAGATGGTFLWGGGFGGLGCSRALAAAGREIVEGGVCGGHCF